MTKLALGVVVALTILAGEASADFMTGNKLNAFCASSKLNEQSGCAGYVEGVIDYMEWVRLEQHKPQCIPMGTQAPQVADVVLDYLRDHPEMRSYAATDLVVLAITKAWNCQ